MAVTAAADQTTDVMAVARTLRTVINARVDLTQTADLLCGYVEAEATMPLLLCRLLNMFTHLPLEGTDF